MRSVVALVLTLALIPTCICPVEASPQETTEAPSCHSKPACHQTPDSEPGSEESDRCCEMAPADLVASHPLSAPPADLVGALDPVLTIAAAVQVVSRSDEGPPQVPRSYLDLCVFRL